VSARQFAAAGISNDSAHPVTVAENTNDYGILTTAGENSNDSRHPAAAPLWLPEPRTIDEWNALDAAERDLDIMRLASLFAARLDAYGRRWPPRTTAAREPKTAMNEFGAELDASITSNDVQANLSENELETE
jgi:hypothetical protein